MIRILIADPDIAARKALSLLLKRRLGLVETLEAADVETLIQLLAETPPDLLLLDWKLYGSPAIETCLLLRKAYPDLKIVLFSVDPDHAHAAQAVGVSFIDKGASPDDAFVALDELISFSVTNESHQIFSPHQ